ncbi:hypothetical protein B0H10DRAFT_1963079 [Mycena sp. CBHHK59/15]|nr:hypothetical protein B0H10DRAFT_1963079 [Mycena sp. CBHHK59/15]
MFGIFSLSRLGFGVVEKVWIRLYVFLLWKQSKLRFHCTVNKTVLFWYFDIRPSAGQPGLLEYHDEQGNSNAVRQHVGRHAHARPPLKRLAANEVEALDIQVIRNPQATAQQLRAAAALGQTPLGHINPILMDPRKTRSEVEKSKSWHAENLEAESGRHGLITDGTHDFFKQGILLTSLAFSQVLFRWVVVLYMWIGVTVTSLRLVDRIMGRKSGIWKAQMK